MRHLLPLLLITTHPTNPLLGAEPIDESFSATVRAAYTGLDARFRDYTVGDSSYAGRRVPGVAPLRFDLAVTWRGPRESLLAVHRQRLCRPERVVAGADQPASASTVDNE